jgi:hypothetical protein
MKLDYDAAKYLTLCMLLRYSVTIFMFSALTQLNLGDFSSTIASDSFQIAFVEYE